MQGIGVGALAVIVVASRCGRAGDLIGPALVGLGGLRGQGEQVVEAPGEVSLEAAERPLPGLALGFLAREVGLGRGVVAGAGDGDDVQGAVELAVTATVEPVLLALTRRARDRRRACLAGEAGVACE